MNGVHYSQSSSIFEFYDLEAVRISFLAPSGGPIQGNTRVTVHGQHFAGPGYRGAYGALPVDSLSRPVPPLWAEGADHHNIDYVRETRYGGHPLE